MSQEALTPQNAVLKICIDTASQDAVTGRIFGQRLSEPLQFNGMSRFLLTMEHLMDTQNFPRAFQRIRTFRRQEEAPGEPCLPENAMTQEEVDAAQGAVATALLRVTSRQSATWQGTLDWLDCIATESFSSDLEFLTLVDRKLFG